MSKKNLKDKFDILLTNVRQLGIQDQKIAVPTISGIEFIKVSSIVRCESDVNYTTIVLNEKKKIVVAKTLKQFEELLSEFNFFRIHNSHLINLSYIKSYNKGKGGSVILEDGTELEVSTRRKEEFLNRI